MSANPRTVGHRLIVSGDYRPYSFRPKHWALLLCLGGCSAGPPVVSFAPPVRDYSEQDYKKTRQSWTRNAQIIKTLDTTLRVHATCYSPEFIAAYVAMNAHMFKLSAAARTQLARQLNDEGTKSYSFMVAAATSDFRWNDFERKETIWRVGLVNDRQEQVVPVEIKAAKEISATTVELFPYVDSFYRVYQIRFPKTLPDGRPLIGEETHHFVLRFAGPLGLAELVWRLR